jgi:uncharacterized membrane protein
VGLHPFRRKINPGVGGENVKIQTKDLALTAVYAALYAALVYVTIPFSFGVAQFRIAGALRPSIAKKWILAFGYGLGVLVANFFSPFAGPWDLIFMPVMSLLAGLAGYLVAKPLKGNFFISGAVTATIIAVSLSYMFEQFGMGPMFVNLPFLFVIEQVVCLIGASIFTLIGRRYHHIW